MRKLATILTTLALLLVVILTSGVGNALSSKLLFYVRAVRLYTADPPARISMPLPGVQKNQIADTWQAPRGTNRKHEGQDIFAPRGTPIYSAVPGYVYNIGESRLGGQTVSVIGAGGRVYYYAHLDSYAPGLEEGDYVTPETKLGSVGTTGNAQGTPPHLHFGVYTPSGAINPLTLLGNHESEARNQEASKARGPQSKVRNRVSSD